MKTGRISVRERGSSKKIRVGGRGRETVEGVIALERLPARARLEGARGVAGDVVPAAFQPVAGARPEAAEVGIVVDDALIVGVGAVGNGDDTRAARKRRRTRRRVAESGRARRARRTPSLDRRVGCPSVMVALGGATFAGRQITS